MTHVAGPQGTHRIFTGELPTLEQAVAALLAVAPGPPEWVEWVELGQAAGRVLAQDLRAASDLPPFDRSTVDGYAVRSADVARATAEQPVALRWQGEVRMGETALRALGAGEAVAVATGAMLPPGADAVVMVEDTSAQGETVRVMRPVRPGENVLPRGADVRAGQVVVAAGMLLGPAQIGALAGAGHVEVPVYPRPRAAVLVTGDELVPPHVDPSGGRIRDMNGPALMAALRRDGALAWSPGRVVDDAGALAAAVERAVKGSDLVLIAGGSSVGTRDLTREALTAVGARIHLHGIALKPGKPTLVATLGECLLIGLPGNPVSALVIYHLLVRPALWRRMGLARPPRRASCRARLSKAVRRPATREELVRVRLIERDGSLWAEPLSGSSGVLQSLAQADGLVWISFANERYAAGEEVEVWLLPERVDGSG